MAKAPVGKATRTLRRQHVTVLSCRDWRLFLQIVDSHAEPNAALRKAARGYNTHRTTIRQLGLR